jgi:pyridinium-3,5-biscarboxylic acid mononucleotide sulfurtransferase
MKNKKYDELKALFLQMKSVLVALSGGVDSSVLAKAAYDALGKKAVAVTDISSVHSQSDNDRAKRIAKSIGIEHVIFDSVVTKDRKFRNNPPERCYHCKSNLIKYLKKIAKERKIAFIAEGSNKDDLSDHRPGMKACKEANVRQPFLELNIGKNDIRKIARRLKLPNHADPASPCLSSRIPYGQEITAIKLSMIETGEAFLRKNGLKNIRVRHHGSIARIEADKKDFIKLLDLSEIIAKKFKKIGFTYTALDIRGFRSGSMNEGL